MRSCGVSVIKRRDDGSLALGREVVFFPALAAPGDRPRPQRLNVARIKGPRVGEEVP